MTMGITIPHRTVPQTRICMNPVYVSGTREASLTDRVIAEVTTWPAVNATRAECGNGVALSVDSRQIVHLHDPGPAHVRLTRPVIFRMAEALRASGQVELDAALDAEHDWVSLRLNSDGDAALLVSLVSVAIKAHAAEPPGVARREPSPCRDEAARRSSPPWRRR
jgi:hypothetical protein